MEDTSEPELIKYSVCAEGDIDAMCDLLAEVFSRSDPPAVAAGVTALEFRAFVQLFSSKASGERLTTVARLADSGEVVGALLTEDAASPMPIGIERLSPKFDPIFDICVYRCSSVLSIGAAPPCSPCLRGEFPREKSKAEEQP